jgi:tartrate dehydratase beta subunit/fumarate hydratase class I family protein
VHAGSGHVPAFSLANTPRTYKKDDLKVDLESVGDIVSFNGNMVVMDSDLANMLMDIPTGRNYQYNYSMFGELAYKAGTPDANGYISQFDRYKAKNEVFSEENDGQIL